MISDPIAPIATMAGMQQSAMRRALKPGGCRTLNSNGRLSGFGLLNKGSEFSGLGLGVWT
jgi:hypothetical protein